MVAVGTINTNDFATNATHIGVSVPVAMFAVYNNDQLIFQENS